jgi:hypothetical protein
MLFALELLFAFLLPLVAALKFDIQAHPGHESASKERCIRNFVAKDQLVVVTATVSGSRGDGQTLNMHVSKYQQDCRREEDNIRQGGCSHGRAICFSRGSNNA